VRNVRRQPGRIVQLVFKGECRFNVEPPPVQDLDDREQPLRIDSVQRRIICGVTFRRRGRSVGRSDKRLIPFIVRGFQVELGATSVQRAISQVDRSLTLQRPTRMRVVITDQVFSGGRHRLPGRHRASYLSQHDPNPLQVRQFSFGGRHDRDVNFEFGVHSFNRGQATPGSYLQS
jgi:hypothetical protein